MVEQQEKIRNLKCELSKVHQQLKSEKQHSKRLRERVEKLEEMLSKSAPTRLKLDIRNAIPPES